jgi:hypothetical protein
VKRQPAAAATAVTKAPQQRSATVTRHGQPRRVAWFGEVVGGVGDESEQGAEAERRRPAPLLEAGQHGEDDHADEVDPVERDRRRHLEALEHQLPERRAIEPVGHRREPDRIEGEEDDRVAA